MSLIVKYTLEKMESELVLDRALGPGLLVMIHRPKTSEYAVFLARESLNLALAPNYRCTGENPTLSASLTPSGLDAVLDWTDHRTATQRFCTFPGTLIDMPAPRPLQLVGGTEFQAEAANA